MAVVGYEPRDLNYIPARRNGRAEGDDYRRIRGSWAGTSPDSVLPPLSRRHSQILYPRHGAASDAGDRSGGGVDGDRQQ